LSVELPWLSEWTRAKRPARLPTVLTREEVRLLLRCADETTLALVILNPAVDGFELNARC
jgi:integrase